MEGSCGIHQNPGFSQGVTKWALLGAHSGTPRRGGFSGAPPGAPAGTPKLAPPGDGGHLTDFVAN